MLGPYATSPATQCHVRSVCPVNHIAQSSAQSVVRTVQNPQRCRCRFVVSSRRVSQLNGKLGDFGLARMYEHNESSHTTRVVGTLGYIAPEFIETGKASPATDVFSFGILLLEVACGRRPVDVSLHATGSLMDTADPNLGGQYVESEMERVLKLGLICSNPHPERRLGIRQVLQILEEEVHNHVLALHFIWMRVH
ncbi:L-type lectin-domain containing receptor kinase SIT2-like [Cryptomeria japonica]|uniref:L-type lectin-domain containing receptor kinase SIT2-like n=1 Tax=Cryptomeria japonica TaxID=3369 RepID=UPI0025ACD182|nr:L-type lectin-domain containing receptor kinase SIT2-like [Cryptomeria japonica]